MNGQQIVEEPAYRSKETLVQFPTYQDAVDCFDSPEYTEAAKLRHVVSTGAMVIVEGYEGLRGMEL